MISLFISLVLTTVIIVLFKLFSRFNIDNVYPITINYAVSVGYSYFSLDAGSSMPVFNSPSGWMSMLLGVLFFCGFTLFAFTSQKVGVALAGLSSKMSVIIPVLLGVFYFGESFTWIKMVGMCVVFLSFYLSLMPKEGKPFTLKFLMFPLLLFLASGTIDSLTKVYSSLFITSSNDIQLYLLQTFFVATMVGGVVILIKQLSSSNKKSSWVHNVVAGLLLGHVNYWCTYFFMEAIDRLPATVMFPVFNTGIIFFSTLVGFVFFKEKLSRINLIGLSLALVAILIISYA